ncbi:MAG: hypothetical protein HZA90_13490 [Verrucomicrobia bacterium]|nr:hypothetical protein [Verrucomicrobiota bacterium]
MSVRPLDLAGQTETLTSNSDPPRPRGADAGFLAQVFNLLHRGVALRNPCELSGRLRPWTPRRMQSGDAADCKSALQACAAPVPLARRRGASFAIRHSSFVILLLLLAGAAPAQQCAPQPPGLIHWWPGTLDAGGFAEDLIGNNQGTLASGVTVVPAGVGGSAFQFDGATGGIALGNVPDLDFAPDSSFSIEAWVNWQGFTDPSNDGQVIVALNYDCSETVQSLVVNNTGTDAGKIFFAVRDADGLSARAMPALPLLPNNFYHVVGVREVLNGSKTLSLYLNGVLAASEPDPSVGVLALNTPDWIGQRNWCGTFNYFNGQIDEVSVYDRALTPLEIQALYSADSAGKCLTPLPANVVVDADTPQWLLDSLTVVEGDLTLQASGRSTLSLPNLKFLGGSLVVDHNGELVRLDAEQLLTVGGSVTIQVNGALTSINLNRLETVGGSVVLVGNSALTTAGLNALAEVVGTAMISGNPVLGNVCLPALRTVGGSLEVADNPSAINLCLPLLLTVGGDLIIANNISLADVTVPSVKTVGGSLTVTNNTTAVGVDLRGLTSTGGDVTVTNNTAAVGVDLRGLTSTGGDVTVTNNTAAVGVDLRGLTSTGGGVTVTNNTAAVGLDLRGLTSTGGGVTVTNNTAAVGVDLSGLSSTGGDVTITGNGTATVTLGTATTGTSISGNLTIETSGSVVDTGGTTATGNVDVSGAGTVSLTAATSAPAATGAVNGGTTVTLVNTEAAMQAALPSGAFSSRVGFSVQRLDPATLPVVQGVDANNAPVNVDPVAAYQFNFAIPTLNADATLRFVVDLAALSQPEQAALLGAVASGSATLAVQNDTPGSLYQTFPVCANGQTPAANGGCVEVLKLDANRAPLPPGSLATPAFVQFNGVAGHFSTYAVVIATPLTPPTDTLPPTSSAGVTPTPNGLGWNKDNVTVNLSATDNAGGSGVASITFRASGAQTIASTTVPGASAVVPLLTREGTTTITWFATDAAGNAEPARTLTVKLDKTPPLFLPVAKPALLKPADHRLVTVKVSLKVWDGLSGANGFTLVKVESSEPDSGLGGGDLPGDIKGWSPGTADLQGQLRAERSPTGLVRFYTLWYQASDKAGNTLKLPALVAVPK